MLRIPFITDFALSDKKFGSSNEPTKILSYNIYVSGSSKGRYPHIMAKRTIPSDQISD